MNLEALLAIGVLVATFGLLFVRLWRRGARGIFLVATTGLLAVGATIGWNAIPDRGEPPHEETPPDRPVEVAAAGYMTSDSCRSCHPREYDSWHGSFHRTMTQVASPKSVMGNFDNVSVESEGHSYRLFRRGDGFWVETDWPRVDAPASDNPGRVERQIVQTTGSHHMQIYWFASGATRVLEQLPIIWLNHEKRWVPRDACFLTPPHTEPTTERGRWNFACISCHTTGGRPRITGLLEMYTETTEFSIACEACHGPAENHVAINANPARRYRQRLTDDDDDASIINPTRLPHRLDSQVCGQCHSLRQSRPGREADTYARDGLPYQPGEDLERTTLLPKLGDTNVIRSLVAENPDFARERFWSDGMIRISGREYNGLIESPCFTHGKDDRRMSCFSCHAMHKAADDPRALAEWTDDQLKPGMRSDQACLQCHAEFSSDISAHSRHLAGSSGSRCYNCHMPHTTYGLLKSIRSHQVSVPTARESVETGRPNACNLCHLDKTLDWTADHLSEWFNLEKPPLNQDQQSIAASALWLLKGDAGQRALIAWSMGWKPAQEASGTEWLPAFLGQALLDPYDAVRFIAWRSLREQPGYGEISYDFVAPIEDRFAVTQEVRKRWQTRHSQLPHTVKPGVLISGPGEANNAEFRRLILQRDDSPVHLAE
jgi:hypothetical protein